MQEFISKIQNFFSDRDEHIGFAVRTEIKRMIIHHIHTHLTNLRARPEESSPRDIRTTEETLSLFMFTNYSTEVGMDDETYNSILNNCETSSQPGDQSTTGRRKRKLTGNGANNSASGSKTPRRNNKPIKIK